MEGKSTDWVRGPSGPTVCRCCFAEGCYKDISTEYFWMGKKEVYCEMLTETFDLSIAFAQTSGPNSNSRLICEPCISRLRDASEFKKQVQECEKMFMQYLDPGRSTVEEIQLEITQEPMEKGVKLEPVKLEKNQSDDDFDDRGGFEDMDEDDLDDQPLTKLASKVPKKESVDLLDLLDNAKAEKRKSSTKAKASPAKKAKTKKETPKATVSKPKPEKKKKGQNEEANQTTAAAENNEDMTAAENTEALVWRDYFLRNFNTVLATTTAYPFKYKPNLDGTIFECYYCPAAFSDPAELRNHNRDRHFQVENIPKPGKYKPIKMDFTAASCKVCAADIPNYSILKSHLAEHGKVIDTELGESISPYCLGSEPLTCQLCEKQFDKFMSLIRHMFEHSDYLRCKKCCQSFNSHAQLVTHVRGNKCVEYTKKSLDIKSALKDTSKKIGDSAKDANTKDKFAQLRNSVSMIITTTTVYPFKNTKGLFQCYYCKTTSLDPDEIRSHNRTQHTEFKSWPIRTNRQIPSDDKHLKMDFADAFCKLCLAEVPDYPTLKSHLAEHGQILDISLSKTLIPYKLNKDAIVCAICNTSYQSFVALHRHMSVHFARSVCDQCGKGFKSKTALNAHRLTHESGVFTCKECDKTYPFLSRLRSHTATMHKLKRIYRCRICNENFPNYRVRLIHLSQVHGHKMPEFPCPSCNKVFNIRTFLTKHIKRSHLQKMSHLKRDKIHACTLCDMKFSTKAYLRNHLVKHNGEKKFQCDICKKAYARMKTLREHLRIHNDDRRFACAVCGLTFIQKCSMKHHMKAHHPTEFKQEFESCTSSTC
ncbi:zinc finger protein 808-like isoform X2 [Leguminivora glycinivorella]|uniref:zinc finger protein 808-like isoform X2 n=1 Tax=Leguminivora glycinivorella TaxID=1035111 RepID=UPI00200E8A13|nr:zinc finger protein 808-like isoform X2 [Leguminivora glycinivorella]